MHFIHRRQKSRGGTPSSSRRGSVASIKDLMKKDESGRPQTPSSPASPLRQSPVPAVSQAPASDESTVQSESPAESETTVEHETPATTEDEAPQEEVQSIASAVDESHSTVNGTRPSTSAGADKVNYLRVTSAVLSIENENANLKRRKAAVLENIKRIASEREEAEKIFEEAKATFDDACAAAAIETAQEEQEILRIDADIDENEATKGKLQLATLMIDRELVEAIKKHGGPN